MPTFTLNTAFSNVDLDNIHNTNSNIIIAKPSDDGEPNVAWLSFRPLKSNRVVWEEQYGIYASAAAIEHGAVLTQLSATGVPAADDKVYKLLPSGYFSAPEGLGTENSYTAINQYNNLPSPANLVFGLYQDASVNGVNILGNAVSAAPVLFNSTAVMTPFTTVYIWVQSQVESNTVITTITSPLTEVTFGGDVSEVSLKYNPLGGNFIKAV